MKMFICLNMQPVQLAKEWTRRKREKTWQKCCQFRFRWSINSMQVNKTNKSQEQYKIVWRQIAYLKLSSVNEKMCINHEIDFDGTFHLNRLSHHLYTVSLCGLLFSHHLNGKKISKQQTHKTTLINGFYLVSINRLKMSLNSIFSFKFWISFDYSTARTVL